MNCGDQFPINEIADPNPMQRNIFPRKAAHADILTRSRSRLRSTRRDRRVALQGTKITRVPRTFIRTLGAAKRILDCMGMPNNLPALFPAACLSLSFNDVHASSFLGGGDHTARFTHTPSKNSRDRQTRGYCAAIARLDECDDNGDG